MAPSAHKLSPRLASSRQWTELPAEFTQKIREIFASEFTREAQLGEFLVDGRIYPEEVIVRVGYLEHGRLKQMNFEASVDLPKVKQGGDEEKKDRVMDRLYSCIDALGSLMEEYLDLGEDEEIDVPLKWRAYEFEGEIIYLQHSTVNTRLEEEADRLLGVDDKRLFNEETAGEDALGKAEVDSDLAFEVQKLIRSGRHPAMRDNDDSDGTAN